MIDSGIPLSGLERAENSLQQTARRMASIGNPESDTVDLSAEAVAMIVAKNSYQANLQVLRTGEQLSGMLLDITA
ncbi:MAG: flagellar basal body rod C-terminal domain-containing protein [Bryobacteraceae bacterium]